MPLLDPGNRYARRLNRVVNHVQSNLHESVDLDRLADVACLSRYHFARVFHDQVGEPPIDFLKRVRLERAANFLQNEPDMPVKSIAYRCGIASQPLFSRNFGDRFDCSPSQYRSNSWDSVEGRMNRYRKALENLPDESLVRSEDLEAAAGSVRIERLQITRVAYARSIANYGVCLEIDNAFDAMKRWACEQNLLTDDVYAVGLPWNFAMTRWPETRNRLTEELRPIGVSWDFPGISADDRCRYDVCVPLPDAYRDETGVSQQILPGGWYATLRVPYRTSRDLKVIWEWFTLMLTCAKRFARFRADTNLGPWLEKHYPPGEDGLPQIELFTRLSLAERR